MIRDVPIDRAVTEEMLRVLRFPPGALMGNRLYDSDVRSYTSHARSSIAALEKASIEGYRPSSEPARQLILPILRRHVAWLDEHPEDDPDMPTARALPTSVLEAALRERRTRPMPAYLAKYSPAPPVPTREEIPPLSRRAERVLEALGVHTRPELTRITWEQLRKVDGCGVKTRREICAWGGKYAAHLTDDAKARRSK